jgi:flagellar protein FliO/FliZ
MMLVLAAVLAAAWLTRRMRGMTGAPSAGIEVLAQVSLGTRERAVLLRVGGRQILVGVAPGSVRALHVLKANADGAPDIAAAAGAASDAARPTFKSMLLKSLGR